MAVAAREPPARAATMTRAPSSYHNQDGFDGFRTMQVEPDDVLCVSYPKCGTSWLHQIVFGLLRMDDDGEFPADQSRPFTLGSKGQVYPDAVGRRGGGGVSVGAGIGGGYTLDDMLEQARPRLFTTHMRAPNLPSLAQFGRLITIARNPKDALVSGYFFCEFHTVHLLPCVSC